MIRYFILPAMCLVLLMVSFAQARPVSRIAVLISYDTKAANKTLEGFHSHFDTHGIKAKFDLYQLKGSKDKAEETVTKLLRIKPDLILAIGSLALNVIGKNITNIPVIASMVLNNESLERYKNVTGVSLAFSLEEQTTWLQRILPESRNIGVLYNSEKNRVQMNTANKLLRAKGLTLLQKQISNPTKIPQALKQLENKADVLWGLNDAMVLNPKTAKNILLFSFRNKIPFIGLSHAWVKAGALYALERDYYDIGLQCAEQATEILAGKNINKVRISTPRKTLYSLNLKIADRLKIVFPGELVANAENIY